MFTVLLALAIAMGTSFHRCLTFLIFLFENNSLFSGTRCGGQVSKFEKTLTFNKTSNDSVCLSGHEHPSRQIKQTPQINSIEKVFNCTFYCYFYKRMATLFSTKKIEMKKNIMQKFRFKNYSEHFHCFYFPLPFEVVDFFVSILRVRLFVT